MANSDGSIGFRLKQERQRLRMDQDEFSRVAGVGKQAQSNYENDKRKPGADYLQNIASLGADVFYILTGERTQEAEPENFEQHLEQCVDMLFEVQQETGITFDKDTYKNALGFAFTTKATKSQMIKFVKAIVDAHSP